MDVSISPFMGAALGDTLGDSPMKPWPALATKAFCLKDPSIDTLTPKESIFFYDSSPEKGASPKGADTPPPVIVLIHGLGDEADSWRHLIPLLSYDMEPKGFAEPGGFSEPKGFSEPIRFRVLALDLPGFGRSVAPGRINLKRHAAAVLKLIKAVVPGHTVFLAGNSMGAVVAEAAALERPDLIRGLILLDGCIPGGPSMPGPAALARLLFSRKWYRAYRTDPEGAWVSLYHYYADLDSMPPEDKAFLRERVMARVQSPDQERAYFATQRSLVRVFLTSASRFARKIRAYEGSILLLWGEKDMIIPAASAKTFRDARAATALRIIPGAGHLPHQEKPAETARIMADWCRNVLLNKPFPEYI